jgi:hypothetical protein
MRSRGLGRVVEGRRVVDKITDPAWFYSSLAQTAAAIVGVVAAVLASRILDHLGLIRTERREIEKKVTDASLAIGGTMVGWSACRHALSNGISADEKMIKEGKKEFRIRNKQRLTTSTGGDLGTVEVVLHKAQEERYLEQANLVIPVYEEHKLFGPVDDAKVMAYAGKLDATAQRVPNDMEDADNVRGRLQGDSERLKMLRERIAEFRAKLIPTSFFVIWLVLAWISVTGVFLPLLYLPGLSSDSSKMLLATCFGVGIVLLLGFFGFQLFGELRAMRKFSWGPEPPRRAS